MSNRSLRWPRNVSARTKRLLRSERARIPGYVHPPSLFTRRLGPGQRATYIEQVSKRGYFWHAVDRGWLRPA